MTLIPRLALLALMLLTAPAAAAAMALAMFWGNRPLQLDGRFAIETTATFDLLSLRSINAPCPKSFTKYAVPPF